MFPINYLKSCQAYQGKLRHMLQQKLKSRRIGNYPSKNSNGVSSRADSNLNLCWLQSSRNCDWSFYLDNFQSYQILISAVTYVLLYGGKLKVTKSINITELGAIS